MTLPAPVFVGFFPKITAPRPAWLQVEAVEEIASVSHCISDAPNAWITSWKHNELGFYDTEELARSVVRSDSVDYDLYAYELFPLSWLDHQVEALEQIASSGVLPADYAFLGYHIVTKSSSDFFECSPLSCNGVASEFATNRSCLIDDERQAYQAVRAMSGPGSGVEPGPYYLFKVYRKQHR
jgi:hypothetical protein